jgi:hypothetical protein
MACKTSALAAPKKADIGDVQRSQRSIICVYKIETSRNMLRSMATELEKEKRARELRRRPDGSAYSARSEFFLRRNAAG